VTAAVLGVIIGYMLPVIRFAVFFFTSGVVSRSIRRFAGMHGGFVFKQNAEIYFIQKKL